MPPGQRNLSLSEVPVFLASILAILQDLVLVSAGVELIFFLVAGVVLCFGFGMKIMFITYRCFQLLLSNQGLFSFSHWPGLPGAWEAGRGHSQDS